MRKTLYTLGILGLLAGCGADGEPVQPTANMGVGVSSSGVHMGGAIGIRKGPVAVSWGF